MTRTQRLVVLLATMAFAACGANFNSIYRMRVLTPENGTQKRTEIVSLDAKQRLLIKQDGKLCTEPSPDAFSVLAASGGGNVKYLDKLTAAFSGGYNETGASIGLRTQSIQLMRDAGYRICEAYASDGIEKSDYATLLRRYQSNLTAVLAVEQLTGAVSAPAVVIGGSAQAVTGEALLQAQKNLEETRKNIEVLKGEIGTQETAVGNARKAVSEAENANPKVPANVTAAKEKEALEKDKLTKLNARLQEAELNEKALERDRDAARTPSISLTSSHEIAKAVEQNRLGMEYVAKATAYVVALSLEKTYLMDFCQMVWADPKAAQAQELNVQSLATDTEKSAARSAYAGVKATCLKFIENQVSGTSDAQLSVALAKVILEKKLATPPGKESGGAR
jgi:hypothetical protein